MESLVSPAAAESPMQALLASLGALDSLKSFSIQGVAEKTLDGFYEKAKQITGKDTYEFGDLSEVAGHSTAGYSCGCPRG